MHSPSLLAMSVAGLAVVTPAAAQEACADDVRALCPDVTPGSGRLAVCLREQQARLSAACRAKLEADALEARRLVESFGRSCGKDVQDYCLGVEPGGGRVLACLAQRQLEISPTCQAELGRYGAARETVSAFRSACTPDVARLCSDVPQKAGPLLECLQTHEAELSPGCSRADLRRAADAASLVDAIEEMGRQDRVRETLEILQGIDSVAFSRSQVLLQYDSFERIAGVADGSRLLFNPQIVFGRRGQVAVQVKVPIITLYLPSGTQHGLADVTAAIAWNVDDSGRVRQYLSAGTQLDTSSLPSFGSGWVAQPAYAIAVGIVPGLSLTTQVAWLRTVGAPPEGRPRTNLLVVEPILVANLPGRSFLALDTKLGRDLGDGTFIPVMKGMAGLFTDRQKTLSISVWYQASLTEDAMARSFDYALGLGLAYYFNW